MLWAVVHAGHSLHFLSTVPVEGGKTELLWNRKTRLVQERQVLWQADHDIDFVIANPRANHSLRWRVIMEDRRRRFSARQKSSQVAGAELLVHAAIRAFGDPQARSLVTEFFQFADMAQHIEVLIRAHSVNAFKTHRVADGDKAESLGRDLGECLIVANSRGKQPPANAA